MSARPSVVIAFAYGASDWRTSGVRSAFERNLEGIDFGFEPIDWRPWLPSPQAHLLRFVRDRADAAADSAHRAPAGAGRQRPARVGQYPTRSDLAATAGERRALAAARRTGRMSLDPLTRPAMRIVHHAIVDHAGITLADVLGYLRDPDAVIAPVSERLLAIRHDAGDRPVVAVGLSLGGIILVDALARLLVDAEERGRLARPADLLVTVGSQSASLRALGVMPSAPREVIHPRLFTPWLNVWHEHDYLSYPVGGMFEHLTDVEDRLAVQRGAFPGVHSGYLNRSSRFFDHLGDAIRTRF